MASDPISSRPVVSRPVEDSSVLARLEKSRARRREREARRQAGAEEAPSPRTRKRRAASVPPREEAAPPARLRASSRRKEPARIQVQFDEALIDDEAAKVVRRLTRQGYEGYLVGGCVRDLLVGQRPKDFDVATSARPEEVRALFRNSRVIGRRFRLVHVLFGGGHIVETATFRKNPPPSSEGDSDDLLIRSDNVFGEAHEDALRRDFTINALFYDLEDGSVLDWTGGMEHIQSRMVHTIGDPIVRFQEDPVRILRAIKFAARLDFGMSPEVYEAIVQCRGTLAMAARPRLSEEVLRLMRGGASHRSIWLAWETGVLDILLPELSTFLADAGEDDSVWRLLSAVDRATRSRGQALDDVVLWTALLLEPLREACAEGTDRVRASHEFLEPVVERLNLPRRIADAVRRTFALLPRLEKGNAARLKKNSFYEIAHDLFSLCAEAGLVSAPSEGNAPAKKARKKSKKKKSVEPQQD